MRALRLAVLLSLAVAGCVAAPVLIPAPEASNPPGEPDVATIEVAGVRLWADGEWKGAPAALPEVLTPVRVTLENRSGHPVRVAYKDFTLLGDSGFRYAALPPFSIQGTVSEATRPGAIRPAAYHPAQVVVVPRFQASRFWVAGPYADFYPGWSPWPYAWGWDPWYYDRYYPTWPTQLPTEDMLEQALPEGVVENGGSISGYIYFQRPRQDASVQLQFQIEDARTGADLGTASVPFLVRR